MFERYNRYEPEGAEALTEMFVSGTRTHTVGKVAEKLLGTAPSASAVSRLNHTLTEKLEPGGNVLSWPIPGSCPWMASI